MMGKTRVPGLRLGAKRVELRRGYALLIVLIAVAILLLLYAADLSIFTGEEPFRAKKDKAVEGPMPWEEEFRLAGAGQSPAKPTDEQPAITKAVVLRGDVTRNDNRRGEIILTVRPNGEVDGYWHCRYDYSKMRYRIEADFAGNIDPTKSYIDDTGQADTSKLFFITKGTYAQATSDREGNRTSTTTGVVYVTGWIKPRFEAFGEITITTDKSWYATYLWSAEPERPGR